MSEYSLESNPQPASLRRRFFLILGLVLLVAGSATLAYGLYGYLNEDGLTSSSDTPLSAQSTLPSLLPQPPDRIDEIEGLPVAIPYNNPTLSEVSTPSEDSTVSGEESGGELSSERAVATPLRIKINAIDVDARIVEMGMNSAGVPYVPLNGQDVAWYNFSTRPGEGSNAVFAGHINWAGARAVFGALAELEPGDEVRLESGDGDQFVYRVSSNFPVDPEDPASLKVMAPTDEDTITLITCGGTWIPDPSEQFGGSYTDRTIVQAELVESSVERIEAASESSAD